MWITGRIKDLIVTAGGKDIAPQPIELLLNQLEETQAVVLGDKRPYLIALFAPEDNGRLGPSSADIQAHVQLGQSGAPSICSDQALVDVAKLALY